MTNVLLYFHVLFAILFLGPLFFGHFVLPSVLRRGRQSLALARFLHRVETTLSPGTALIAVLGVLLVETGGWSYDETWIWLAIVLVVLASVLGGGFIGPATGKAIEEIEAGGDATRIAARLQVLGLLNVVNLALVLWLMIEKPGIS